MSAQESMPAPLIWSFDGSFADCLADIENTLRRALIQVGDVSGIGVLIELSLPALLACSKAGEPIQPAWSRFLDGVASRYGLPRPPRVRYLRTAGPLATLIVAYRTWS
jgi:hypothetical protein